MIMKSVAETALEPEAIPWSVDKRWREQKRDSFFLSLLAYFLQPVRNAFWVLVPPI